MHFSFQLLLFTCFNIVITVLCDKLCIETIEFRYLFKIKRHQWRGGDSDLLILPHHWINKRSNHLTRGHKISVRAWVHEAQNWKSLFCIPISTQYLRLLKGEAPH